MRYFDTYRDLLNHPYDDGDWDCYGLCRRYYLNNYDIELPDYGRSADFFADGAAKGLIADFMQTSEFKAVDVPLTRLEVGDGLLLSVPYPGWPPGEINHMGVFVGNGLFLHHPYRRPSCEDALTPSWQRRVMAVVRHPLVTEKNAVKASSSQVDVLSLIPDHVKQRYGLSPAPVLETPLRESGPSPAGRNDSRAEEREPDTGQDPVGTEADDRRVRSRRRGDVAHSPKKQRQSVSR